MAVAAAVALLQAAAAAAAGSDYLYPHPHHGPALPASVVVGLAPEAAVGLSPGAVGPGAGAAEVGLLVQAAPVGRKQSCVG